MSWITKKSFEKPPELPKISKRAEEINEIVGDIPFQTAPPEPRPIKTIGSDGKLVTSILSTKAE